MLAEPVVGRREGRGAVLETGEHPPHHMHADLDGPLRPDPLDHLEVALGVRGQQLPLRGLLEARDGRLDQRVGQLVRLHDRRPRLRLHRLRRPRGQAPYVVTLAGRGVVAGQLGVDGRLVRHPVRGERGEEGPAQLLLDVETVDPGRAVQQPAQQPEVLLGRGDRGEEAGPGQLVLTARLGGPQLAQRALGQRPAALLAPVGGDVVDQRGLCPGVQHLEDADVALAAGVGQHQRDEVAGRENSVPGQAPQGRPAQRTGQRVRDLAQTLAERGQRHLVETDLAVGEVVVVDQDQIGPLGAGQRLHHGPLTGHVHLGARVPGQLALGRTPVQADRDAVRAQLGVRGGGLLDDGQLGEDARRVVHGHRGERVDARRLEPGARPGGHVPPRGLGQHRQQVPEPGVAVRVALEVAPRALQERVPPHVRHELLQHGGALGVRDPVEVQLGVLQVTDVGRDGVRGGQLVGAVGPGLAVVGEGDPAVGEAGRLDHREGAHEVREGLLQPQVVPPLHGDQVAEPHVRHLVQDDVGPPLVGRRGDLAAVDVLLAEGDHARVLHGPEVVLRHERLVVLAEGVGEVEVVVEEVQALLGDEEDVVRVEVLGEPLAAHRAERDVQRGAVGERTAVVVAHVVVRAGDDGGDVGGDRLGLGEPPHPALP
ncbi:3-deoxy-D-manno-octulosonic acid (KDO) 8-phosphate synthase [Streptomyces sp. HCCB10043]|nr:3-deoxy-D-manno-octulosonic acid (KDO) 8-phosphate synthase [Streptomyces sp. HCCB10043]